MIARRLRVRGSTLLAALLVVGVSGLISTVGLASAGAAPVDTASASASASAAAVGAGTIEQVQAPVGLASAVEAAQAQEVRSAVAVLDTDTGQLYGSGDIDGEFPAESVVKVLIAARLLSEGLMTGPTEELAEKMITQSDDDAADSLWGLVGGPDVLSWAEQHYDIPDLGSAPLTAGRWGNTKLTARGLAELYAALKADTAVGPWLLAAMHDMTANGSDGTDQRFGLPQQVSSGAFKQGWGGDDDNFDSEGLNSTGFLDSDRYVVVIFTQHIPYVDMSQIVPVIDALAAAVAPGGNVAASSVAPADGVAASSVAPADGVAASSVAPATPVTTPSAAATSAHSAAGLAGHLNVASSQEHTRNIDVAEGIRLAGALVAVLAIGLAVRRARWPRR